MFFVLLSFAAVSVTVSNAKCTSVLTDAVRKAITDQHNSLRSSLALGKEVTYGGGYAPSASNMNKFVYNCTLESQTQKWVDQCTMSHSSSSRGASENLYMAWGGNTTAAYRFPNAIDSWWSELKQHGISDPSNKLTMDVFNSGVGHFTAQAWAKSTDVGCGYKICNSTVYIACRYYPMGNYINQLIYKLGTPCSACGSGKSCSTSEGLCH